MSALWDEFARYVYFVVTVFILLPLKSKWDKWRKDNRDLVKKVDTLEIEVGKLNDKFDSDKDKFVRLEKKIDDNQEKSQQKNDKIFQYLARIDKATAINTSRIEDKK